MTKSVHKHFVHRIILFYFNICTFEYRKERFENTKVYSEAVNRRTYNAMTVTKMATGQIINTTQKTKD